MLRCERIGRRGSPAPAPRRGGAGGGVEPPRGIAAKSVFESAAADVKSAPHSVTAWEAVEELAREHDAPDEVVALFREVLRQKGSTRRWSR
ncbi:MAG: hypothetical protein HS111_33170 [Kofleriaceae bacterium]|nr:hypothetical protein [Kofleriaceae bacterium]